MIYPKIPLAQRIVQLCLAKGVKNIVISPGSRNAPLTIGFANSPDCKCYSIVDERCAAFFALGIAQQTGRPAALVCTSGSALLNYYPAIAEAFYSHIPLIIISADRPPNKIDIGDGQTIRQANVFSNHILYSANLFVHSPENDALINDAINIASTRKGPTHINAPFEEPLYETVKKPTIDPVISAFAKVYQNMAVDELILASNIYNSTKRKMILVGTNPPNNIDATITEFLAKDPSVIVMTESTSNWHDPNFVSNIDTMITRFKFKDFASYQPDLLITFGGMIISKRIKTFLRRYKPDYHWHIDPFRAYDTFGAKPKHYTTSPNDFFMQMFPFAKYVDSDYQQLALRLMKRRKKKHLSFMENCPFSDLKVYEKIFERLKNPAMIQISNSAAIRYAQLFDVDPQLKVFCNRGTSGIDGSMSTAIGAAVASDLPTYFLTGDIGFFYDSNALWNNYIPSDFKIIIVNNGGGGIFRILPGHKENDVFNTFFETQHNLTAEHFAKMFDFAYFTAAEEESLMSGLQKLENATSKSILEIFTPVTLNDKVLSDYFKSL